MYKLNKKGFAVTTVVYSILVLLILFMFILLAIVRGSYFNEKDFTKEVQVELDTYLKNMGADTKKPVCTFDSSNIKLSVEQIVSVTLTCLDEAGINEDTIDKENFKYSNVSIEEIAKGEEVIDETVSTKSGYKYVIKIKGTEVGNATFTFKGTIHDKSGNPNDSVSSSLTVSEKISKPICTFTGPDKNPITGFTPKAIYILTCTGKNLEITDLKTDNFTVGEGFKMSSVESTTQSTTELKYTVAIVGISKGKTSTITLKEDSVKITDGDGNDAVTSNSVSYVECTNEGEIRYFDGTIICVDVNNNGYEGSYWEYKKCTNGVWIKYEDKDHKSGDDCKH